MHELQDFASATIVVVDDQEQTLDYLVQLLHESGCEKVYAVPNEEVLMKTLATIHPDIAIVDWHLRSMEGDTVIRILRELYPGEILPVIVLTGDPSPEVKTNALLVGATEFLNKPFSALDLVLRIRNLLELRQLHLQLAEQKYRVEEVLRARERELGLAQLEILERLARAAEYHDDLTGQHIVRVGRLSEMIGRVLGLDEETLHQLRFSAPLHDIGKIAIPDTILRKPGKLSHEERRIMREHTIIGARMLEGSTYPPVQMARIIALTHHERWDGRGYPCHLKGTEIPLWGRIVAVADAYDAMTHDRPYRPAMSHEMALQEIRRQRERQFDPMIVDAFLEPSTFAKSEQAC